MTKRKCSISKILKLGQRVNKIKTYQNMDFFKQFEYYMRYKIDILSLGV